jgi:hypothetical protein
MTPHPRTLRKARMQVQQMVIDGLSAKRIRRYLHHFLLWWVITIDSWTYKKLVIWFIETCRDICPAAYAAGLLRSYSKELDMTTFLGLQIAA